MRQLKIHKAITNRETQSLDKYLQEIGKMDLISSDEEVNLAQRIRQGDHIALEKLTSANLRFVVSVAKQYQNFGLSLSDLISEGNLGLIKAAKRFDETRGFKFISYAVWWIRQSIMQSLAEHSRVVRLPLNRVNGLNKLLKTFSMLEQQFQREPAIEELADTMGVSENEISETFRRIGKHVSIDAPFSENEDNSLLDVLSDNNSDMPDAAMLSGSLKTEIKRALSKLTWREIEVVSLYFGLNDEGPLTLDEISARFNLTQERVRQIKEKATRSMRSGSTNNLLKSYL